MSEHETEAVDVEDEIAAQMSDDTEPGEPEPEPEPTDPEPEPNLPPEPESAQAQMAKMDAYAIKAKKYLARNMDEVLGEESQHYVECPFCNYFNTPGFLHASPCPPELLGTVYEWTNQAAPDDYKKDTASHICDACDGLGEVLSGSKVQGRQTLVCVACKGNGWVPVGPERQGGNLTVPNGQSATYPPPAESSGPVVMAAAPVSPEAQALRDRGYIVIDPIHAG